MTTPITTLAKYFKGWADEILADELRYQHCPGIRTMGACDLGCGKGSIGGRACAAYIQAEIDRRATEGAVR